MTAKFQLFRRRPARRHDAARIKPVIGRPEAVKHLPQSLSRRVEPRRIVAVAVGFRPVRALLQSGELHEAGIIMAGDLLLQRSWQGSPACFAV